MRRLIRHTAVAFALGFALPLLGGEPPRCDFSFTTREGEVTTLSKQVGRLRPGARVLLLLFDPDCGECHEMERSLADDPQVGAALADGSAAVIAIYPTDGLPHEDDPNFISYLKVSQELPAQWTVGIDNGSIFETDACVWDNLPLLLDFEAARLTESTSRESLSKESPSKE